MLFNVLFYIILNYLIYFVAFGIILCKKNENMDSEKLRSRAKQLTNK